MDQKRDAEETWRLRFRVFYIFLYEKNVLKEVIIMLKKLNKFLCCTGCVGYVGLGSTIIYCGAKICKWGLTELENDIKM